MCRGASRCAPTSMVCSFPEITLSLAAVYAAIAFYYDHKADIERQIQEDEAFVEAFRRNNPSKLRQKLKALSGE